MALPMKTSTPHPYLHLRRTTGTHQDKPTVIETDLPGHSVADEFNEDYLSYLITTSNEDASQRRTVHGQGTPPPVDWLAQAKKHKEKGNSLFRITDKYNEAAKEYRRAIHCIRRVNRTPETDEMRIQCYLNITACDLGLGDYASARAHSSKVLKQDSNNVKALFRRAQARKYAAYDLDGAEADLEAALNLVPDDALIKRTLDQLRRDRLKSKQSEAVLAKKMFTAS